MGRQLSRLECEYVLSEIAELKPPLEVSLLQSAPTALNSAAVCSPRYYTYNPKSMSFFFDEVFVKKANLPHGVPCRFCFFYKTRRLCFMASFSFVNGKSFCRAESLFYADEDTSFLPSARGSLSLSGDSSKKALALRIHKNFSLNTANKEERKLSFFRFAESPLGEAAFRELEACGSPSPLEKSGILFYLDCNEALAAFPLAAVASLLPRGALESRQKANVSLTFGLRTINAEGEALASAYSSNLLLCTISLFSLEMENVRFIYEMSHGKKYTGA